METTLTLASWNRAQVSLPGAMMVLDMGGEYAGYATDITCSYPNTGKVRVCARVRVSV
jgi:Xaa-Pro aminopeptidase